MDKNAIKRYAVWARQEMIKRVAARASRYGITEDGYADINADNVNGMVLSAAEQDQRRSFIHKIRKDGYKQAIEEVAYTWFNRFCALRYMEANGYLPAHIRVFTNAVGEFKPQILAEASHLDLEGLDIKKVYDFKDANDTEGLYRYLLIIQCNALNAILPGMFQKIEDYSELLLPDNLLREGNVLEQMITQIQEEDWKDQVQIIGWLYQYYNAEKKDEVFAALKRNVKISKENIPAATQLFTPDWIVRYMVENSLGRLWVEGHPNKKLQSGWEYYLEEVRQEPKAEKEITEIRKEYAKLKPEDIRCIDPCAGSGHILVYIFDVLMQIYGAYGYTTQQSVKSILENNLYGLDIDDRAVQLTYFAVMMKARSYDRDFFNSEIQPHVYAIQESNGLDKAVKEYFVNGDSKLKHDFDILVKELKDAKEYGSIINITPVAFDALYARVAEVKEDTNLYDVTSVLETILPLIQVGEVLARKYDVVVTNPPYMSGSNMNVKLSEFVKANYSDSKSDLFAVFIEKCGHIINRNGYQAMVTQHAWMFLSSFEKLREKLLHNDIINMAHLGARAFEEISGEVVQTTSFVLRKSHIESYKGTYCRLVDATTQQGKESIFLSREEYYIAQQDNFSKIPGSPVAYWISETLFKIFSKGKLLGTIANPKQGIATANNNYYLRLWFEVENFNINLNALSHEESAISNAKWYPYNKGGEFRKWYGNTDFIVNWYKDGLELHNDKKAVLRNQSYYFKDSVSWSKISSGDISFRYYPSGYIFDVAGCSIFYSEKQKMFYDFGFINSNVARTILSVISPTLNYEVGHIASLPIIRDKRYIKKVNSLTYLNVELVKYDWDSFETSWDFKKHPLVPLASGKKEQLNSQFAKSRMEKFGLLSWHYDNWVSECNSRFQKLKANEEELNRIFIDIYGLQDELTPEVENKDVSVCLADKEREIKSLISYAVGCMFGRYSLDKPGLIYAGGKWDDSQYTSFIPDDDAIIPICDDEYFPDDIVGRFVEFIEVVYGKNTLEKNLQFIADALGGREAPREVIRNYFLNNFYADHCKIYQKHPIYWLFDSGKKNGFKCLIYLHRYDKDMLARIRTYYIHDMQSKYNIAAANIERQIKGASRAESIKLAKTLNKLTEQADELHKYEEKIHNIADMYIKIDLDDGVKVNYEKFKDVLAKIK